MVAAVEVTITVVLISGVAARGCVFLEEVNFMCSWVLEKRKPRANHYCKMSVVPSETTDLYDVKFENTTVRKLRRTNFAKNVRGDSK